MTRPADTPSQRDDELPSGFTRSLLCSQAGNRLAVCTAALVLLIDRSLMNWDDCGTSHSQGRFGSCEINRFIVRIACSAFTCEHVLATLGLGEQGSSAWPTAVSVCTP
ncbi:hypothetical protein K440DRAFT_331988 [Wilcoxina mikolae CBS 423.85]|nr:hypothetical protein K440DRAFT_331988 [Wilcoxina mikolae CBS 423.85]